MADIFSYAKFISGIANSDFDVYITNPPSQIDYGTILLDIFLSVWFSLSNSTAERITTATRNYFTKLASTAQNTFEYSNPLVSDRPSAGLSATQSLLASNNSTIEVTIDENLISEALKHHHLSVDGFINSYTVESIKEN